MGLFGFGSKKENRTSSSANNGQELARRFQSQSDWSGMTLGEFRKALEFAIRQGVYSGASDQQWAQILPMYKNEIEMECRDLERIVNMVRAGKGHQEEILGSIMRLQNKEYSYQQYLLSKLGEEDDA